MTANISDDIPMHFYCRSFKTIFGISCFIFKLHSN